MVSSHVRRPWFWPKNYEKSLQLYRGCSRRVCLDIYASTGDWNVLPLICSVWTYVVTSFAMCEPWLIYPRIARLSRPTNSAQRFLGLYQCLRNICKGRSLCCAEFSRRKGILRSLRILQQDPSYRKMLRRIHNSLRILRNYVRRILKPLRPKRCAQNSHAFENSAQHIGLK